MRINSDLRQHMHLRDGAGEIASQLLEPAGFSEANNGSAPASKLVIEQSYLRVSIIIPTYHRSKEFRELLNSLLRQIVKPMEVIIVDDTPTDVIRRVCREYEARFLNARIALVYARNTRERSTTIARNFGAKIARGDILTFVDSDMILFPDYIKEVLKTFGEYPQSLGVAGWIMRHVRTPRQTGARYYATETIKKLFFLFHNAKNRCTFPEYTDALTRTISCQRFSGSNMSWRRDVFDEYTFDENLKGYAFMEDVLFSGTVYKRHPGKLLMTPHARCYHNLNDEGRPKGRKLRDIKFRNRKYVLTQLFGVKGLLIFGWENFGLLFIRLMRRDDLFL